MRGPFLFLALLLSSLFVGAPALAQEDAGVADAGPGDCDPRCEGDTLRFCDGDEPVELDCREVGSRCGMLSAAWGDDCLLGDGAACDPGYAFGESRCDRLASLYCVDGQCEVSDAPPGGEPDEEPTPGTEITLDSGSTDPFGCSDCGSSGQAAALIPALVLLRLRRKR